ncbi:hypothetical protein ACG98G_05160 [Megasphaera hexanoica]|uniref:Uncharacterized protein n=1 Tax=Megasphaera hexanoica TaxID=1675036 RepID=A0ABW7DQM3_9FIRM|nr:hypothetical protein [Megasphaera hexanoica]AXB82666.1 hypothetical protein ACT01_10700 [Megasphaera hexanoica]
MNIIRWILVIPAFVISYVVMRWICLFLLLSFAGASGIIYAISSCIVEGGLAVGMGLFASIKVAPSHKTAVIYMLSVLVSLMAIFNMSLSLLSGYGFGDVPKLQGYATIVLTIITCIYTSYKVKKDGIKSVFPDAGN